MGTMGSNEERLAELAERLSRVEGQLAAA